MSYKEPVNSDGMTLEEWRKKKRKQEEQNLDVSLTENNVHEKEPRNIHGETLSEYRKRKNGTESIVTESNIPETEVFRTQGDAETYRKFLEYQNAAEAERKKAEEKKKAWEGTSVPKIQNRQIQTGVNPMHSQMSAGLSKPLNNRTDEEKIIRDNQEKREWMAENRAKRDEKYADILAKASEVVKAPDFEEKSKYEKSGRWFPDIDYEYVNNPEMTKVAITDNGGVTPQTRKGYEYVNDEERAIYNYIYSTEGKKKAKEYLEALNLEERMAEDTITWNKEYAKEKPVQASVTSVLSNLANAGQGFVESALGNATGYGIDINSYGNVQRRASNAIRETVAENIENPVGKFFYQTGMSMADSVTSQVAAAGLAMLGLPPAVGASAILASNAATDGIISAKERGVSDDQALMTGIVQGGAEWFFEKVSLGNLEALKENAPATFKELVKGVLKQGGIEGSEEVFTSIANAITDQIINKDLSELNLMKQYYISQGMSEEEAEKQVKKDFAKQIGMDFLGGFASGTTMSTAVSTFNYALNKMDEKASEKAGTLPEETETLPKESEMISEESEMISEESEMIPEEIEMEETEQIPWEEAQMYAGEPIGNASAKGVAPAQKIEENQGILKGTKPKSEGEKIIDTVLENGNVSDNFADEIVKNDNLRKAFEAKTGITIRGNETEQRNTVKAVAKSYAESHTGTVEQKKTAQNASVATPARQNATIKGKGVEIVGVETENGSELKFKDSSGNSYTTSELKFADGVAQKLYGAAAEIAMVSDSETANSFVQHYEASMPIQYYAIGFDRFYSLGKMGVPKATALKSLDFLVSNTSEEAMMNAWNLGNRSRENDRAKVEVKKEKQKRKGTGTYEDQTRNFNANAQLQTLVANRTGIDIKREAGTDENTNGYFIPSMMQMVISDKAANEYATLLHELGEFGLAYNKSDMKELQNMLLRYQAEQSGIKGVGETAALVKAYQQLYAEKEGNKTYEQAVDEMVNDALAGLFSSDEGVDQFVEWLQKDSGYSKAEQKSLVQQLMDLLDHIVKYLKTLVKEGRQSAAALKAAELEAARVEELRTKFLEVLEGAIETAHTTGEYESDTRVKYHVSDKLSEEIDDVLNGTMPSGSQVKARDFTPAILVQNKVKNLPMLITQKHVKTVIYTEAEAKSKGIKVKKGDNYHGLGKELFIKAIDNLDDPAEIYKTKDDTFLVVTELKDSKGDEIVVPIKIKAVGNYNGLFINENQIKSVYGRNQLRKYLQENHFKQIYKKKRTALKEGVQYSNLSDSSTNILAENNENATHEKKNSFAGVETATADKSMLELANEKDDTYADSDIKYSFTEEDTEGNRDTNISYDSLIKKPNIKTSIITTKMSEIQAMKRKDIVQASRNRLVDKGYRETDGVIRIRNQDSGEQIVIGVAGLNHGLDRNFEYTSMVCMHIDSYLENAILINQAKADSERINDSDIYLGYGETEDGEKVPAYFVVSKLETGKTELVKFSSLYSLRGKNITEDSAQSSRGFQAPTSVEISVKDLLNLVKETYSDILPKDVADALGVERRDTKLGRSMKYSIETEDMEELQRKHENTLRENDIFRHMIDYLTRSIEATKGTAISEKSVEGVANRMIRRYKSEADKGKVAAEVQKLFEMMSEGKANKEDFLYFAEEAIRPVVEQSKNNKQISDYAKGILSDIRKTPIKLGKLAKQEAAYHYGSYNDFRRKLFGRAQISNNGTDLDILWQQWSGIYPELFDAETVAEDQPVRLAEIIDALKEDYDSEVGYNLEEAVTYAAMELMEEYAKLPEVKALTAAHDMAQMQRNIRKLNEEYRQQYEQKLRELKGEHKEKLARQEAKFRARMTQSRSSRLETQERKKYKDSIVKNTKEIMRWLEVNNDKYHVPEVLRETTIGFLGGMDFMTENGWNSQDTVMLQNRLNILYRKLSAESTKAEGDDVMADLDPDFLPTLDGLISLLEQSDEIKKIGDMDSVQLKDVAYLVGTLKRVITTANRLIANKQYQHVSQIGDSTVSFLARLKAKKQQGKWATMGDELLNLHMLDSRSFFEEMGEAAGSLWQELRDGFNQRTWKLERAKKYMEEVVGDSKIAKWTGKKAETHSFEFNGQQFDITTGQLMTLYLLSKRPQAYNHLMAGATMYSETGGFTIDAQSVVKGQKVPERRIKVTDAQMKEMFKALTPEQIRIAKAMQKFLAKDCAEWGNEVSMTMYGYKKFGEATYWPIKTNDNFNKTDDKNAETGAANTSLYAIRNQGMTKNLVKNASNPIVVGDVFEVFAEHVANMANYNAFVIPLSDAMKWFNYRSRSEEGAVTGSIKEEMERSYGKGAKRYFINFIKDINGEVKKGVASEISSTFTSKYKAAAVGANLRVVIQQPTAIFRAMSVMNPRYLAQGIVHGSAMKEMHENSAVSVWKSWGYFETGLGQSMKQVITGEGTVFERIVEGSMAGAGLADDLTWGVLWNAVKAEVQDKYKDIDTSSEEYIELVRKRFDEVIDQTQVVDTVLHRSQMMRSGEGVVKMASAFMAEPTKSYNLLHNAIRELNQNNNEENRRKVARRAVVYGFTAIATAALASVVDAFRDDDEEKEWAEKWIENWKANAIESINPISQIPYLKELSSLWQGFDSSRMDMAGVSTLVNAVKQAYKYINGESKKTLYGVTKGIIRGMSQVTGIPLYNALRDVESTIEQFTFAPFDEEQLTGKDVRIRLIRAMREGNEKQVQKYLSWYDEQYKQKLADGKTDQEAKSDLKKSITSQYKEIYQNSTTAEKIEIKKMLLKIRVNNQQLYKGYDWSSWDEK